MFLLHAFRASCEQALLPSSKAFALTILSAPSVEVKRGWSMTRGAAHSIWRLPYPGAQVMWIDPEEPYCTVRPCSMYDVAGVYVKECAARAPPRWPFYRFVRPHHAIRRAGARNVPCLRELGRRIVHAAHAY